MSRRGGGSRGSSGSGGSRGYSRSPPRSSPPPSRKEPERKYRHTKETVIIREPPRQAGVFGTMASTAAGVAVGSAVGHAVGETITGGHNRSEPNQQPAPDRSGPTDPTGPCAWEIKQFLNCAESNDVSVCEGFNEAIRACKKKHGMS